MPKELVTYSQLHSDLVQPNNEVFDTNYEGMSFETIPNQNAILKMSGDPSVLKMNLGLIADEQHFTASPKFLLFERIKLK